MDNPVDPTVARLERRLKGARYLNLGLALVIALLAGMLVAGGGRAQNVEQVAPTPPAASPQAATSQPAPSGETPEAGEPIDIVRRDPNDTLAIGDINAPVVLSEWADLRCPYCARVTTETMPTVIAEYVDTGKVRIEFHDVSFFGEDSTAAAVALRAAAEQGKFAEYLYAVHDAAPAEGGHPDLPRETLIGFAETAGVPDLDRFTADLDRQDLREAVEASTIWSQQLGISSVPFFVAGNQAIAGAESIDVFRQLLDEQLAAAGQA